MRALVTGATGFLGSRLARTLVARDVAVRALVRASSDRRRLAGLDVEEARGDVTDRDSIARAVRGADLVYHCAAVYELGTTDPDGMRRVNVGGTENVLASAQDAGVPAVYVSSVAALGPTGIEPVDESHRRRDEPRSAYEATKREAHDLAEKLAGSGGRIRVALPGTIYGPDDDSLTGILHRFTARGVMRVGFLADLRMSLVHLDDCVDGLIRIAEGGRDGERYILAAQVVTFKEWFEALARAAGRKPPKVYLPAEALRRLAPLGRLAAPALGLPAGVVDDGLAMSGGVHWAFSCAKARRELGWAPRPLDRGEDETMAWYKEDSR